MTASTTMPIQSRLISAPVAWNNSQSTKRMTAATMSMWIISLVHLLIASPSDRRPRRTRVHGPEALTCQCQESYFVLRFDLLTAIGPLKLRTVDPVERAGRASAYFHAQALGT